MKIKVKGKRYLIKHPLLLTTILLATCYMIAIIIPCIIRATEAHDAEAMSYCMEHSNNYNYCFKGLYGFTPRS